MKRLFLSLLLVGAFVTTTQAQSCEEAVAYYVPPAAEGEGAQQVAQTVCTGEVMRLNQSLREQNVALEAWSRANNAVAYGFGTIFTVSEADPTPQVVLLETETSFFHNPLWSPDGTQLVVIETEQSGASEWLVVSDLDSNTRRLMQLSANAEDETIILPVVWSPDGDWISYALSQQVDEQNWGANILLLDTACIDDPEQACEPHELEITDDSGERPSLELEGGGTMPEHWWGAVWSPDGEQLAFVCGQHLCFLNADGTNFRRLDFEFQGHSLAWSPSGRYLAYVGDDIYAYDIEEDTHINITETPDVQEFLPVWIPLPEGAYLFETE